MSLLVSPVRTMSDDEIIDAVHKHGGMNQAARALGIPLSTFKDRAKSVIDKRFTSTVKTPPEVMPPGVYIFSAAQAWTSVNIPFLKNLQVYAKYRDAKIFLAGYVHNTASKLKHKIEDFHPEIRKYIVKSSISVADKVLFCAEMNITPTQADPLMGLESYTRDKWAIFPHPRVSLKAVPVRWGDKPKHIMTTGVITKPNYLHRKVGLKAEFHHIAGAVIVEVDNDGDFFARHLIADESGSFQDLLWHVNREQIKLKCVEAVTWGDLHPDKLDPDVARGSWGLGKDWDDQPVYDNMLDVLKPSYQFFHDSFDMGRRSHHDINDPHKRFKDLVSKTESVEDEVNKTGKLLKSVSRAWCKTVVVDSNHDRALMRWLKTADYKTDPVNALFFLRMQHAVYSAIERGYEINALEQAIKFSPYHDISVRFLRNTESFTICNGAIECGMHGDIGANGAKGHINSFAKMGPKANIGHSHSAAIHEGVYVAGHSCVRDLGYNRGGLTSWSPSHVVTYPNGKRTIVTMSGDKFCGLF